jgi:hypothetical protein
MVDEPNSSSVVQVPVTDLYGSPRWLQPEEQGYSLNTLGVSAFIPDDAEELSGRLREMYCVLGSEAIIEVRDDALAHIKEKLMELQASVAEPGVTDERMRQSPAAAMVDWEQRREAMVESAQEMLEQEIAALHWFENLLLRIAKVDHIYQQRLLQTWWEEKYKVSKKVDSKASVPVMFSEAVSEVGLVIGATDDMEEVEKSRGVRADGTSDFSNVPVTVRAPSVVVGAYRLGIAYFHWRQAVRQSVATRRMRARNSKTALVSDDFPAPEAYRRFCEERYRYEKHGIVFAVYRDLIKSVADMAFTPALQRRVEAAVIRAMISARDAGPAFLAKIDKNRLFTADFLNRVRGFSPIEVNGPNLIEERYGLLASLDPLNNPKHMQKLALPTLAPVGPVAGVLIAATDEDLVQPLWDAPYMQERLINRARMLADLVRQDLSGDAPALGEGPVRSDGPAGASTSGAAKARSDAGGSAAAGERIWTRGELMAAIGHLKYALLAEEEIVNLKAEDLSASLDSRSLRDTDLLQWAFRPGTVCSRAALEGTARINAMLTQRTEPLKKLQRHLSKIALAASAVPVLGEGAWVVAGCADVLIEGFVAPQELAQAYARKQLSALVLDAVADTYWIAPSSAEVPLILLGAGASILGAFPGTGVKTVAETGQQVYSVGRAAVEVLAPEVFLHAVTAGAYILDELESV